MSDKKRTPLRSKGPADHESERRDEPRPAVKPVRNWKVWFLMPVLLAATLAAYYPVWHGRSLRDDDRHMTRSDLQSAEGLWRIRFDLGATQQYYPVAHSAFWIQHWIWGDDTPGYRPVSIVLALSARSQSRRYVDAETL